MAVPIIMPQIGQDIETGKIVEWRVRENQQVKKGDILAVVESDKATFDVEAYDDGVLLKILHHAGEEARVFSPIGYLGQPGESTPNGTNKPVTASTTASAAVRPALETAPAAFPTGKQLSSPTARRIAGEHNLDWRRVQGSGPHGRIVKRDVLAQLQSAVPAAPEVPATGHGSDDAIPLSRMRLLIAERMTFSKQNIPHFYLFSEVDMTLVEVWRAAFNQHHQARITITDIVIKAVASLLPRFPRLNAILQKNVLLQKADVNIGVAVSVPDGLLVPVVAHAQDKTLPEISQISRQNAEAARAGKLGTTPATFTISNLGMYNITTFLPIINAPEVAILGVGSLRKKVVAQDPRSISIHDLMEVSLACDHRAIDGAYGAQFLAALKDQLEHFGA
jgi:pyruvate dehydrogenase E2 component (dihydrolipoamide acetyltransferase)